jgi:hypothetical protein
MDLSIPARSVLERHVVKKGQAAHDFLNFLIMPHFRK